MKHIVPLAAFAVAAAYALGGDIDRSALVLGGAVLFWGAVAFAVTRE